MTFFGVFEKRNSVVQDQLYINMPFWIVKLFYWYNAGLLFSLLDAETDPKLLKHIRETITSMLQALADNDLKHWLALCKQVLLASNVDDEPVPEQNTGEFYCHL